MATTVSELPAGSGSNTEPTPASISFRRASTRLYCSVQKAAASSLPPVHSDCIAILDVRRSTLINLTSSLSLSITLLVNALLIRDHKQKTQCLFPLESVAESCAA